MVAKMAHGASHPALGPSPDAKPPNGIDGSSNPTEGSSSVSPTDKNSMQHAILLFQVAPEYSEQALKAKLSGTVKIHFTIDERGDPTDITVIKGLGMGLDERAVEAVRHYKFKPAMRNGQPIRFDTYVDVNFQVL